MNQLPPRWLESVLERLLPDDDVGRSIRGDLREEFCRRASSRGRFVTNYWYLGTAATLLIRYRPRRNTTHQRTGHTRTRLMANIKHSFRRLRRSPLFVSASIASIGISLGTATALLTLVKGVLLTPLPYPQADELISIQTNTGGPGWYGSSAAEFIDLEQGLEPVEAVSAYVYQTVSVGDSTNPRLVFATLSTHTLNQVLGVEPLMGRWFNSAEDQPGADPVVVLSEAMWRNEFDSDPQILGRTIDFPSPRTVIGVMPATFSFPVNDILAYAPLQLVRSNPNRTNHNYTVVGRLGEGETVEVAGEAAAALAARARETYPENYSERGYQTRVISLLEDTVGIARAPLMASLGAAVLLLMMGIVNVATLVVARAEKRKSEVAVMRALGASKVQAHAGILIEGAIVSLLGGIAGIVTAIFGTRALIAMAPASLPRIDQVNVEWGVVAIGLTVTAIASIVFSISSAGVLNSAKEAEALNETKRTSANSTTGRLRSSLVTVQIALSASLTMGSLLMARSISNLVSLDPGLEAEGLVSLQLSPDFRVYADPEQRVLLWERITQRVEALPGIERAAAAVWLPFAGPSSQWSFVLDGQPVSNIGAAPDVNAQQTTPAYFETMGLTLLSGRFYDHTDEADGVPVAVINETMARTFWPGEDALGKRFRLFSPDRPFLEVIGIIRDVRHDGLATATTPRYYHPHSQGTSANYFTGIYMALVAKTDTEPLQVVGSIREAVHEIDPTIPISNIATMKSLMQATIDRQTFTLLLLGVFAGMSIFLAGLGVFGTTSYVASLRRREFGIRIALGATGSRLSLSLARSIGVTTAIGLATAVLIVSVTGRYLESMLFGLQWFDPVTFLGVIGVIASVAGVAGFVPAKTAAATSPMESLRID